jgi:hypothetical protein
MSDNPPASAAALGKAAADRRRQGKPCRIERRPRQQPRNAGTPYPTGSRLSFLRVTLPGRRLARKHIGMGEFL